MTNVFRRRTLLRGITAGLASVPALSSLYGGTARADGDAPKRLIIYWTPNGTVHERFFPDSAADLTAKPILAPLAEHKDDLVVLKTIFSGTGDHKTGLPFSTTGNTAVISDDEDSSISIDQEIANAIGKETPLPSLTLAGQTKDNRRGYISANADGSRNAPIRDPWKAYEYVYGPYNGGGGENPGPDDLVARRSILDTVMSDIEVLQARVAGSERQKLEAHLEAIRQLEQNIGGTAVDCDTGNNIAPKTSHDYAQRIALHSELIASAFACDLTRTVSFMTAPAGHDNCNFGFLGVSGGDIHQSIAHSATWDNQTNEASNHMATVGAWHAEELARLINLLKSIPEGDGTIFDNTAILWTNECAWGNHGHNPIPVVLAGTMGGYFRNGMYLEEELLSSDGYRSILTSLANGMGHGIDTFGIGESSGEADVLLA
jgi:hypothetical protein